MSHFNACVLVKKGESNPEQMVKKANDMLANFDINKEVEPHKYYVEIEEIQRMAKSYGIDTKNLPANLPALAEKLEDWNGDKGGVDESGLYGFSTENPDGHIDAWFVFVEVKPEDRGRLLFCEGGEKKNCAAIVTPDGKWYMGPWIYGSPNAEWEKELEAWNKKLITLLDKHKDVTAFLADCHI